jgi:transcription initiation factor TFIID subunit 12
MSSDPSASSTSSSVSFNSSGHVRVSLASSRYRPLINSLSSSGEDISPELHAALTEVADEFVENIANFACSLARLRGSSSLSPRDIQLAIDRKFGLSVPSASVAGSEEKENKTKRSGISEIHKRRLASLEQLRKIQAEKHQSEEEKEPENKKLRNE